MTHRWHRAALLCLAAGLMAAAQAPVSQPAGLVLGLTLVFHLKPQGFASGWLLGLIYFALTLNWIVEPFFIDAPRHGWMAPFALTFMAGGLALFWGTAFALASPCASLLVKISCGGSGGRKAPRRALPLALLWALAEYLRGTILTGFPWAGFSQGLMDTPAAWGLPFAGPAALTLALLLTLAAISQSRTRWPAAIAFSLALTVLPGPWSPPPHKAQTVRVVQPNAPQDQKWDPLYAPVFFDRMLALTAEEPRAAITLWPEMAVPYDLYSPGTATQMIAQAAGDGTVVTGSPRISLQGYHNSLIALRHGTQLDAYDKTHLVPFGEYLPLPKLFDSIGLGPLATANVGNYTPGTDPEALLALGDTTARPLICYEGIFPEEVRRGPRPGLLLLITNDAWFGTRTGPYQHLLQARMRALELGLPLLRSANTGVSAIIDARGNIIASIPLGEQGQRTASLPLALPATPYARFGDLLFFILLLTAFALLPLAPGRKSAP